MNRVFDTQFSIKRMMVGFVVLAMVLAFANAFPVVTARITVQLLIFAPAATVFGFAYWFSNRRERTMLIVLFGVFMGWVCAPQIFINWSGPPNFWAQFKVSFFSEGVFMFASSLIAAILDFVLCFIMKKQPTT